MNALSIRGLSKVYKNGIIALNAIDLDVEAGDFFALLGPNGAGKSTIIGAICSLVNKTAGQIVVFGNNLDSHPAAVKRCIGLVPQEFNFNQFQLVGEIIVNQAGYYGISRREAWIQTEHVLRQLELWERRNLAARDLSGGMKRRLMIARALVHSPKLLILDEPTAGVDIEMRRHMWTFLRDLNAAGTTIMLTTHYLEEVENLCRNLAIIDQGRIVEQSSLNSLLNSVQTETFILNVKLDNSMLHLSSTVEALKDYSAVYIDQTTIEVKVSQTYGLNKLFRLLTYAGCEVVSMRNKQNRLEQLLIGRNYSPLSIPP